MKADPHPTLAGLGLSKDPFKEITDEFFGAGERGRQLEELRHPARWTHRLLVVTGERGVGKSTLFRALSGGLDPGVKAARINANLTSDTREILSGIIHGFGMAAPANADSRLLIELIALHVHEQIGAKRDCLVMVDDAHLLELRALAQLLKLVNSGADDGLRIVFFAEAYFVQSLDKASKRSEPAQKWREIRLMPFADDESRRYIAFRVSQAGVRDRSVFAPNELSVIVGGSSGVPGRIDELASAILSGKLTVSNTRRWLPRTHRALAILVLIAAGMGWLIFNDYSGSAPADEPIVTDDARPSPPSDLTGTQSIALPTKEKSALATSSTAYGPIPIERDTVSPDVSVDSTPAVPNKIPATEPEPPINAAEPAVTTTRRTPQATTKPTLPPVISATRKSNSAQWLRAQPPKFFTLQLFATTNRANRDSFIERQDHAERFATFETKRNGSSLYVVTYGSYPTRAEATSASSSLPPSVGRVQPWIRSFASIQAILN